MVLPIVPKFENVSFALPAHSSGMTIVDVE